MKNIFGYLVDPRKPKNFCLSTNFSTINIENFHQIKQSSKKFKPQLQKIVPNFVWFLQECSAKRNRKKNLKTKLVYANHTILASCNHILSMIKISPNFQIFQKKPSQMKFKKLPSKFKHQYSEYSTLQNAELRKNLRENVKLDASV